MQLCSIWQEDPLSQATHCGSSGAMGDDFRQHWDATRYQITRKLLPPRSPVLLLIELGSTGVPFDGVSRSGTVKAAPRTPLELTYNTPRQLHHTNAVAVPVPVALPVPVPVAVPVPVEPTTTD